MEENRTPVLSVLNMVTHLRSSEGIVRAVDGVSFDIAPGETLGLVGESGSGKTITALSLLSLIPKKNVSLRSGRVELDGVGIDDLSSRDMRALRGSKIAMIFQEPITSLNPVLKIGWQIAEPMCHHLGLSRNAAKAAAIELLHRVGIPSPRERAGDYPHQLSGGMRQRAMIAMAVSCRPRLLIADEPTTALDVTIQAQILALIDDLKRELDMAVLLITHNFGIVAQTADRTAVMYAGKIVEHAPTTSLFDEPSHPYTAGLLGAMPKLGEKSAERRRLKEIPGIVPRLTLARDHCSFAPRCDYRFADCFTGQPDLSTLAPGHQVRCFAQQASSTSLAAQASVTA
jgi:peptide/nickel transport system ATP-binding protein